MEDKDRQLLTTSKVLSRIRTSQSPSDAVSWHSKHDDPLLKDILYALMQKRGLQPKDVILKSGIERSYFYHIISGNKHPSRNMILRIGICVNADYAEMNRLLRLSGQPALYSKLRRDALLIYAIGSKMSMAQANALLLENGEPPLYREEKEKCR